jgi:hypothetical protein
MSKDAIEDISTIVEKTDNTPLEGYDNPVKEGFIIVNPGDEIELETEGGYVKFSDTSAVKMIKRSSSRIVFKLNYSVAAVEVSVKKDGEISTLTYTTER